MQIGKYNTPIWDDDPTWVTPPHLSSDQSCDVCVVGLGASGLAAVLEIAKSGFKVIGIDAIDVAAGAAGRNGGFLLAGLADFYHDSVKSLGRDKALKIYRDTITELEKTFEEYPECTKRTGSLRIAASQQELEDCKK